MSYQEYPPTIDLVETPSGSYVPVLVEPGAAPIEVYRPASAPSPNSYSGEAVPRYDSGTRGMSDSDFLDFGTDRNGNPNVIRNPNTGRAVRSGGRARGGSFEVPTTSGRSINPINRAPRGRRARKALGEILDLLPVIGTAIDTVETLAVPANFNAENAPEILAFIRGEQIDLGNTTIGRAAGYQPQTTQPIGTVISEGFGEIEIGQCPGLYFIELSVQFYYDGQALFGPKSSSSQFPGPWAGPTITTFVKANGRTDTEVAFTYGGGAGTFVISGGNDADGAEIVSFSLTPNGFVDDCGERGPGRQPIGTNAPPTTTGYPPNYPDFGTPEIPGTPTGTNTDPPPVDGPDGPELPGHDTPDLPDVPELPEEDPPGDRPDPPTPDPQCCPSTERSLDNIQAVLKRILEKLQGSGEGALDLKPCDYEDPAFGALLDPDAAPVEAEYEGEGLAGIYSAIAAIEKSLNAIHGNTKCPTESSAALPMFWELKHGEIPQLVVSWRKVEPGSDSKWSMTIPHPIETINRNYPFDFPEYIKGGNLMSVRLTDNSQIRINAFSEEEAQKVVDYVLTLVDPVFLPPLGPKIVYSKGVADFAEVAVKAVHIKKFNGHKTGIPVWAKSIAST
ncbi:MAG: hypothetical protein AAFY54_01980 [Cyanobacteria bacterium J06648_10]